MNGRTDDAFWAVAFLVALGALILRHSGRKLPAQGAAHLACEYANASQNEWERHRRRRR